MKPEVPNLSLTMYLFGILTDEHVPLKCLIIKYLNILSLLIIDIFNDKHMLIFENNIYWYMY